MPIEKFAVPDSEDAVRDLRERLARTRWPDTIPGSGWTYGFDLAYLQRICEYWREHFDWKALVEELSQLEHFRYTTGDDAIHFVRTPVTTCNLPGPARIEEKPEGRASLTPEMRNANRDSGDVQ